VPFPPHPKYCFCALCIAELQMMPDFHLIPEDVREVKCECGADKTKDGGPHSTWCPKVDETTKP
jgi:hypothetical protein